MLDIYNGTTHAHPFAHTDSDSSGNMQLRKRYNKIATLKCIEIVQHK